MIRLQRRASWFLSPMLILASAAEGTAQEKPVPERELGPPEASFSAGFGSIRGLRELSSGRVLLADGLGQALMLLDLAAGTADTIGRVGQGPDEYRLPDGLFPLPGDSTLLVDLGNGRLTALGPDLGFGETTPITHQTAAGGMSLVIPLGTDAVGRIYFQASAVAFNGGLPDSAGIVRWDRRSDAMDTVGRVRLQKRRRSSSGGSNDRQVRVLPVPFSAQDAWAVGPDGRVAVARADVSRSAEYRLDWIQPDGRLLRGPPVSYRPVPVRKTDREEWLSSLSGGLRVSVTNENGRIRTSFSRGGGGRNPLAANLEALDWPDTKPAFPAGAVRIAPDGRAWVERHVPAGQPRRFDVFGPEGRRLRRVALPEGRDLVGFGKHAVYLKRKDAVDFEWLERYGSPNL